MTTVKDPGKKTRLRPGSRGDAAAQKARELLVGLQQREHARLTEPPPAPEPDETEPEVAYR